MKIEYEPGKKGPKDRKILITTRKREPITIFRLGLLANQLGINEMQIHDYLDFEQYPFFFGEIIADAISDAKRGVDWAEPEYKAHVVKTCEKWKLKVGKIDHDLLRRTQQRKLEECK